MATKEKAPKEPMPPLQTWLPAVALGWLIPGGGHFLLGRRGRAMLLAGTSRGTHVHAPEVRVQNARRARIEFDAPPLFDADGDLFRATLLPPSR
jgi:hypothetical protein